MQNNQRHIPTSNEVSELRRCLNHVWDAINNINNSNANKTTSKVTAVVSAVAGSNPVLSGGGSGSGGTVTSVSLTMPADFAVTGSPVISAGTLAVSYSNQNQGLAFMSPKSSTGVPTFRAIYCQDINDIASLYLGISATAADSSKLNGQAPSYYQVAYALLTTLGSLTNAAGALCNSGTGTLSWNNTFLTTISGISAGGDLGSTYPNPTVLKLNGQALPAFGITAANLRWSGTAFQMDTTSYQPLAARLTAIANLIAAAGVLKNDGADNFSYVGSALAARTSITPYTTGTLAAGAATNFTVVVKKSATLEVVATDHPAWIRIYGTAAALAADASRNQSVSPTAGTGIYLDAITTAGILTINLSPAPSFVNNDTSPADVAYVSITNLSGASTTITLNLTYLPEEA